MKKVKNGDVTDGLPQDSPRKGNLGQILGRHGEVYLSDYLGKDCCCLKEQPHKTLSGSSPEKQEQVEGETELSSGLIITVANPTGNWS